jgi:hypothetical protein
MRANSNVQVLRRSSLDCFGEELIAGMEPDAGIAAGAPVQPARVTRGGDDGAAPAPYGLSDSREALPKVVPGGSGESRHSLVSTGHEPNPRTCRRSLRSPWGSTLIASHPASTRPKGRWIEEVLGPLQAVGEVA